MRNTILATIAALSLSVGPALAVTTGVSGGSVGGASVSSTAYAVSSGNGSAHTSTGGYQQSISGFSGSAYGSRYRREGYASVGGVAAAHGGAYSETHTRGTAAAGSETEGSSFAVSYGSAHFDTHRKNPEGYASGVAVAGNHNEAKTSSYGYGGARKWNRSGTTATFSASAYGDRDGYGTFYRPHVDYVETSATASSESYRRGGGYRYGNGYRNGSAYTGGVSVSGSHAESGHEVSND